MANRSRIVLKRLEDRDRGAKALLRRVAGVAQKRVKVGVFGEKASARHADSELSNVEIATINEFGMEDEQGKVRIPERSFIRSTVDAQAERIRATQRRITLAFITGKLTEEQALALLGEVVVGEIRKTIQRGVPPPNAPSTVKAKGSSKTLVDTGQLFQSIAYEVVSKENAK